jgi:hypothetical protein
MQIKFPPHGQVFTYVRLHFALSLENLAPHYKNDMAVAQYVVNPVKQPDGEFASAPFTITLKEPIPVTFASAGRNNSVSNLFPVYISDKYQQNGQTLGTLYSPLFPSFTSGFGFDLSEAPTGTSAFLEATSSSPDPIQHLVLYDNKPVTSVYTQTWSVVDPLDPKTPRSTCSSSKSGITLSISRAFYSPSRAKPSQLNLIPDATTASTLTTLQGTSSFAIAILVLVIVCIVLQVVGFAVLYTHKARVK